MAFTLPDYTTEDRLLARARRGDSDAIPEIYELYFPAIYQYIRLQVEDTTAAEDIAADVFTKLIDTLGRRGGPQQSLRGWLFQVARNAIYKQYGRNRRLPKTTLDEWIAGDDPDVELQAIRAVEREHIQRALRMMAPEQREVLILRFIESCDLEQTGEVMGKSVSAIKSLQFRAIQTLRQLLGQTAEQKTGSYE